MADMAIILSISKGPTRWRGNLKGLSFERGWLKSVDNLGASPFKRELSNDTTFSQTNLAGQSLEESKMFLYCDIGDTGQCLLSEERVFF
jgi:hypothetical protein